MIPGKGAFTVPCRSAVPPEVWGHAAEPKLHDVTASGNGRKDFIDLVNFFSDTECKLRISPLERGYFLTEALLVYSLSADFVVRRGL